MRAGVELRRHIHVYVGGTRAALDTPIDEDSRVQAITAISGG